MAKLQHTLDEWVQKAERPAAKVLDQMPAIMQEGLVKLLAYPYQYPELDSFFKCLVAIQAKKGYSGLIGDNLAKTRQDFIVQMQNIRNRPTAISQVEDYRLPLPNRTIAARHYHPKPNKKLPMLVFYHGGGFVIGNIATHDEVCRIIAKVANVQVLSIEYPLAPEHSPHDIIQTCEQALAWTYQNKRYFKVLKNRIAIAGDSAGGNICAVVAQRTKDKLYAPQAQFLIYPALDFNSRHPSFYAYKDGLLLTGRDVERITTYYVTQHQLSLSDPIVSPTFGDLKKLAPTYIITAGCDVLHDEGEIYSHKLRQAGVKVHYAEYMHHTHGFINLTPISKRAKTDLIQMSKNFRKFWDKCS